MALGYLALVLHAHLPFVRHPESDYVLEEEWLYEAITETYIPILRVFRDLKKRWSRIQNHHESNTDSCVYVKR